MSKRSPPPQIAPAIALLNADTDRRLLDLFAEQEIKRANLGHFKIMQMDELRAIAETAKTVFGSRGLLESGAEEPGALYLGYYIDPPSVPSHRRRRKLIFRFYKHSELVEQIRLFRSMTGDQQREIWGSDPNPRGLHAPGRS